MDAASDVSDGSHMPPLKVHVVTPSMAHSVAASEVSASAGPASITAPGDYAWGSTIFFQPEQDKLKAGLAETQMGIEEAVPATQRVAKFPKARPMNQHPASRRVMTLKALSDDVKVLILSGMQGSGVEGYIKHVTQMLKSCGAAVQRIGTDQFLGARSDECDLCKQCAGIRLIRKVHRCTMCPEALNVDQLNAAINREADVIRASQPFVEGIGRGIIVLEGAFVLAVQEYHDIAVDARWWFSNCNTARCKKECLQKRRQWARPYSKTESEYLAVVEKESNQRLWRLFFHEERWAESMSSYVDVDHVVDLDIDLDPKALSPVETFCSKVRLAAGVTLPPLVFSGGTIVADSINVDVVSESSGPLATTPTTKRKQR